MTLPGPEGAPVQHGIYRYIRHPNYLGVELEILAVPLVHSACLTSLVFGVANALLLRDRIRREEQALEAYGREDRSIASSIRLQRDCDVHEVTVTCYRR